MSDPEGQVSQVAQAPTIAQFIDELLLGVPKQFEPLTQIGREGAIQSEGEIRRGVIAMNGAGLLAVISLLSQSLHASSVRAAALLYLVGLLFGWIGWAKRALSSRSASFGETAFITAFTALKAQPIAQKPLTTLAELEETEQALQVLVTKVAAALKRPGRLVPLWTFLALGCFLFATVVLVVDFELSPRRASPIASQACSRGSGAPAPLASRTGGQK